MSHVRTQIRVAVAAALKNADVAEGRVYASRVYPHNELPAVGVYTLGEEIIEDRQAIGAQRYSITRALQLTLEGRVMGPTQPHNTAERFDDALDTMAAEIEPVMASNDLWGGLAQSTDYLGVEIEYADDLEQPLAIARFQYRVVYSASATDPTTPS